MNLAYIKDADHEIARDTLCYPIVIAVKRMQKHSECVSMCAAPACALPSACKSCACFSRATSAVARNFPAFKISPRASARHNRIKPNCTMCDAL